MPIYWLLPSIGFAFIWNVHNEYSTHHFCFLQDPPSLPSKKGGEGIFNEVQIWSSTTNNIRKSMQKNVTFANWEFWSSLSQRIRSRKLKNIINSWRFFCSANNNETTPCTQLCSKVIRTSSKHDHLLPSTKLQATIILTTSLCVNSHFCYFNWDAIYLFVIFYRAFRKITANAKESLFWKNQCVWRTISIITSFHIFLLRLFYAPTHFWPNRWPSGQCLCE